MWKWLMRYRGEVMVQGRNALMRRLLQASIVPARRLVAHGHPSPMSDEVDATLASLERQVQSARTSPPA